MRVRSLAEIPAVDVFLPCLFQRGGVCEAIDFRDTFRIRHLLGSIDALQQLPIGCVAFRSALEET